MKVNPKQYGKIIGSNLVVLLVVLAGMEVLLRWLQIPYRSDWTPMENAIARFDPDLGWSYRPNLSTAVRLGQTDEPVSFDAHGVRVPAPGFEFDYTRPSILLIGGSFTMGHGLAYEETLAGQITKHPDFPLQPVNLGVQAYGTDQSYLALQRHFSRFKTKLVVYTFINNHVLRNGNYDRRMLYPQARFLGTKPLFTLDRQGEPVLQKKPRLYADYHHSWLWDAGRLLLQERFGLSQPYPLELTHALIKAIQKFCNENGAQFVVLHWRISPQEPRETLRGSGAQIIDLLDRVPGLDKLKLPGDAHPDARANRAVADLLIRMVANSNSGS